LRTAVPLPTKKGQRWPRSVRETRHVVRQPFLFHPDAIKIDTIRKDREYDQMKRLSVEATDAIKKVHELAAYREDCINKNILPLIFPKACKKFRISPYTAQKLAPELFEKWNDINFHWEHGRNQEKVS
jgi:hypothetical protein